MTNVNDCVLLASLARVEALFAQAGPRDCNFPPLPPPSTGNNCSEDTTSRLDLLRGVGNDGGVAAVKSIFFICIMYYIFFKKKQTFVFI